MELSTENSVGGERELNGWEKWQELIHQNRLRVRVEKIKQDKSPIAPEWLAKKRQLVADVIFSQMTEEERAELDLFLAIASYNKCRSECSEILQQAKSGKEALEDIKRTVWAHK